MTTNELVARPRAVPAGGARLGPRSPLTLDVVEAGCLFEVVERDGVPVSVGRVRA
jgi:hypothetical protein